jgi:hypothetical protein
VQQPPLLEVFLANFLGNSTSVVRDWRIERLPMYYGSYAVCVTVSELKAALRVI